MTDTLFTSPFIPHQSPVRMSYSAAYAGFLPPDPAQPFRYLELGCGTGTTLNGLAAANGDATFVGIDFNAEHIDRAREAADSAELSNVSYIHASFEQVDVTKLGVFDFVAIHGAYSWLAPEPLEAVHHLLASCLREGGLAYIDYLSLPGAEQTETMWRVMRELTAQHSGGSTSRARRGIDYLKKLRDSKAGLFEQGPLASGALELNLAGLKAAHEIKLSHLAHHALAEYSKPYFVTELAARMADSGLRFAGSTDLRDADLQLSFPAPLQQIAGNLRDPVLTELLKQTHRMKQTRQDVFVKGGISELDRAQAFIFEHVPVCLLDHATVIRSVWAERSKQRAQFPGPLMELVFGCLEQGAMTAQDVARALGKGYGPDQLLVGLHRIVATSATEFCRLRAGIRSSLAPKVVEPAGEFNKMAFARALKPDHCIVFASPVLGSCIPLASLNLAVLAIMIQRRDTSLAEAELTKHIRTIDPRVTEGPEKQIVAHADQSQIAKAMFYVQRWLIPSLLSLEILRAGNTR